MEKKKQNSFLMAAGMLGIFGLWTAALCFVDVQAIGPMDSKVGFATFNQFVHRLTGVHMTLYTLTDWLGLIPLGFVFGFALLGLSQWIRRKQLWKVDHSLLVLGGFYAAVMAAYLFFEAVVINYRPVLIGGILEASYPSSTTMLVLCVMPTALMQLRSRLRNGVLKGCLTFAISGFIGFMVMGRLLSGVHWFTDIVGGVLLSSTLVLMYRFFVQRAPDIP